VAAVIHPDNHASRRVAEKCGLRVWKEVDLAESGTFLIYRSESPASE
jgi:RimJ/RimL family protein N-acetyltransferase